ncbi:MAG: hypothetical protein PVG94_05830 [Gammaproteobacteria bacterium]
MATSVLPVSLQRMATAADLIFHGRAISNEVSLDEASGRVATFTTFEIIELVKGETGPTHTIKQIGGQLPGNNMRLVIRGVPRFTVGEEYVVFLPKASSLGFASPIGLAQGKFNVSKQDGEPVVSSRRALAAVNGAADQSGLMSTPSAFESGRSDSARLPDFLNTVRGMIGE